MFWNPDFSSSVSWPFKQSEFNLFFFFFLVAKGALGDFTHNKTTHQSHICSTIAVRHIVLVVEIINLATWNTRVDSGAKCPCQCMNAVCVCERASKRAQERERERERERECRRGREGGRATSTRACMCASSKSVIDVKINAFSSCPFLLPPTPSPKVQNDHKRLDHFMVLHNRTSAQVLVFLYPCDLEWSRLIYTTSYQKVELHRLKENFTCPEIKTGLRCLTQKH